VDDRVALRRPGLDVLKQLSRQFCNMLITLANSST
jgi:hypothetical protein